MDRDDKALYSGNATGQVILWSSEEELEAERAQRNKEISTSLAKCVPISSSVQQCVTVLDARGSSHTLLCRTVSADHRR
jgi:hypothetical protein